jgi:hypothetical protein
VCVLLQLGNLCRQRQVALLHFLGGCPQTLSRLGREAKQ